MFSEAQIKPETLKGFLTEGFIKVLNTLKFIEPAIYRLAFLFLLTTHVNVKLREARFFYISALFLSGGLEEVTI